ncbi:terminase large subunit domain-containing protein [Paracoccus cavernae]|uniref:terminase large subunit domain-containing protein n=1 Tax=Paracoccus cavernae TaxID=1571207 RepID=UPI003629869E
MSFHFADDAWSTAVPDWENRIVGRKSLVPELPLYDAVAEKALRIFKRLRVPDLVGKPTYGEVCGEWVFDLVRVIFGAYDPETKRRAISEIFLLVPKKNGKSLISAAIMVTALILNERPACELVLVAPSKKVAGISFSVAVGIIEADGDLSALFKVQEGVNRITHLGTQAVLEVKAADLSVVTGSKAAYVLIDELHELSESKDAAKIMVELRGGLLTRPDGFFMMITTQSKDKPTGVFRAELLKARAVRDGSLVLPLLAVLYELPESLSKKTVGKRRKLGVWSIRVWGRRLTRRLWRSSWPLPRLATIRTWRFWQANISTSRLALSVAWRSGRGALLGRLRAA